MSDVPRGASSNYQVMSNDDIKNLKVKELADPNGAILVLWVPSSLLQEGLDTMKFWGFNHKQTYIWVKVKKEPFNNFFKIHLKDISNYINSNNVSVQTFVKQIKAIFNISYKKFSLNDLLAFGMGRLFRQTHEIALVGTNNNGLYKSLINKSQRSVCFAENLKHSSKPECLQDSLELMFPHTNSNKIELFARRIRPNWICLGNEVCNGEDIRDSIEKLI